MAFKKKRMAKPSKKAYTKKRGTKRNRKGKQGASHTSSRNGLFLPQRYSTKLKYTERLVSVATNQFHTNDQYYVLNAYDPAAKSGNYGCHGFRQLGTQYTGFICYGSKIKVKAMNNSTSSILHMSIVPTAGSLPLTNDQINNVNGMKYAKHGNMMNIGGAGANMSTVSNYISAQELFALRKDEVKFDPTFKFRTVDGKPFVPQTNNRAGYWNIVIRNVDPDSFTSWSVALDVEIEYYLEFFHLAVDVPPTVLTQDFFMIGNTEYGAMGVTGATGAGGTFDTTVIDGDNGDIVMY